MRFFLYALLMSILPFNLALATGNATLGKEKSALCVACHGPDGNSLSPIWPKLAGQHTNYLVLQLQAFKGGKLRNVPAMTAMVANLTTKDMEDIAAFYNSQKGTIGEASKMNFKRGEQLYRGGDNKKHIAACIACHGPNGSGNGEAGFPSLSGQHAAYTVSQLKLYQSGERKTGVNNIMQDIAKRMDEKDMNAVANYIQGLH